MADAPDLTAWIEQQKAAAEAAEAEKAANKLPAPLSVNRGYAARTSTAREGIRYGDILGTEPGSPGTDQWGDLYSQLDAYGGYAEVEVDARYTESHLDAFGGMSPEDMAGLQSALYEAGLISKFHLGVYDDETMSAMKKVLGYANRSGLSWEAALSAYGQGAITAKSASGGGGGGGGARGPVFQARLSNPEQLKEGFKQGLYNALGGKFFDDGQIDQMVKSFHEREYAAQRSMWEQSISGSTITDTQPDEKLFVEEQAQAVDATGVKATKMVGYANILSQMLGG